MDQEIVKVSVLCSKRWTFTYIAILGFVLRESLRVNMGVALVCMVRDSNDTNVADVISLRNDSSNDGTSSCSGSDSSKEEDTGEFDWDKTTQSIILSSYFYGYMVLQLPGGWLASRFGGKRVFGVTSLFVSVATLLIPVASRWDYKAMAVLRALIGLAQAVTTPTMHAMLGRWAPKSERSRLSSFIYTGAHLGSILTYVVSGVLCAYDSHNGWVFIFYIFGAGGLIWVAAWFYLVFDTPDSHPTISKAERDYIVNSIGEVEQKEFKVPWMCIVKSRGLWACLIAHVCTNWMSYTLLTGLPTFMKEVLKFDIEQNGILSAVPYMVMAVMTIVVGQGADYVRRRYISTTNTRKLFQAIGLLCSGGCMVAVGFVSCHQRALAVVILAIAMGFLSFAYAGALINHVDFAPRYAGVLLGITNCCAAIPGIVAPVVIGQLTPNKTQEEWRNVFYVCGLFMLVGAIVFGCFAQGELEPWAVEREDIVVKSSDNHGNEDVHVKGTQGIHNLAFDEKDVKMTAKMSMDHNDVQSNRL